MKTILFAFFLLFSATGQAQHYYNDIVGAETLRDRMKDYSASKVKSVTATGFDEQGMKTKDFNEWQEVDAAAPGMKVTSRTGQKVTKQQYQFDKQFNIISITETSGPIKGVTVYSYDTNNNITSIKTTTTDSLSDFSETKDHQWKYNAAGKPVGMWQIVNGRDSSEYRLTVDEKGNIADEQLFRRGVSADAVYYYYNEANKVTDIVRFDKKVKQLLPDVMFEYDENNRVIQRITTLSTTLRDYLIFRYLYNDKGLKTKEAMFGKMKQLKGRIEYGYTFGE